MSNKKMGNLFYDMVSGCYDIRFGLEEYYGGLHCGECFEVLVDGGWVPVRIEMNEKWYLVGMDVELDGLRVRI